MNSHGEKVERLVLTLFGEFNYQITGGAFQSLKSRKSEAVLLALALSNEAGVSRNVLVNLLWPDLTDTRARAGLRQALSRIRSLAPDILNIPRAGWLSLSREFVNCDLWDIIAESKVDAKNDISLLRESLLTIYPVPTTEFEGWIVTQKRTLLETIRQDLTHVIKSHENAEARRGQACLVLSVLTETDEEHVSTILGFHLDQHNFEKYTLRRRDYIEQLEDQLGLKPSVRFLTKYTEISDAVNSTETQTPLEKPAPSYNRAPILAIVETFRMLDGTNSFAYLSETIPQEIISHLTRQKWFEVQAVDTDRPVSPPKGGLKSGHAYSVYGNIRADKKMIAISIRLTDRASGKIVWSQTFEESIIGGMDGHAKIVDVISETLLTKMVDSSAEHASTVSDYVPASMWINTMKARHLFWQTSQKNNDEAKLLLKPVIQLATPPISALITATFTRLLHIWSAWEGNLPAEMKDAMHIAEKSVRLYPTDPWAHFALATCFCALRQHDRALQTINRAIKLHDSFATGLGLRGHIKVFSGYIVDGEKDLLQSLSLNSLDPHYGIWQNSLGVASFLKGDHQTALEWVNKAMSANSYWMQNYALLVCVHSALGNHQKAQQNYDTLRKVAPNLSRENWLYSHPFGTEIVQKKFLNQLKKFGF